jgi:hypothetical protein
MEKRPIFRDSVRASTETSQSMSIHPMSWLFKKRLAIKRSHDSRDIIRFGTLRQAT